MSMCLIVGIAIFRPLSNRPFRELRVEFGIGPAMWNSRALRIAPKNIANKTEPNPNLDPKKLA